LLEENVGGGEAGVELDRLLERRNSAIGAACPEAGKAEREMGIRIAAVEGDRALR
jgi:hypothetical protein